MRDEHVRTWALKGAEHRLAEIADEARAIFAAFPELRGRGRGFEAAASTSPAAAKQEPARRRRRRLSPEARKRIVEAQRKRWAEWKAKRARTAGGQPARKKTTGTRRTGRKKK